MGQYKLWFSFYKGIGIYISMNKDEIEILLPFVQVLIGLREDARDIYFFGD